MQIFLFLNSFISFSSTSVPCAALLWQKRLVVQTFKFLHQLSCCQLSKKDSVQCSKFAIFIFITGSSSKWNFKKTTSEKGTIRVSVNCQHPGHNISSSRPPHTYNSDLKVTNSSANKIHIDSDTNYMSKLPVTSTENKTHIPELLKPAIHIAADKLTKSLGTNKKVTITVPNGVNFSG